MFSIDRSANSIIGHPPSFRPAPPPRIVVCADTRVDASYLGSSEGNVKMGILGHGFIAMLAGDYLAARDFHDLIRAEFMRSPATDKINLQMLPQHMGLRQLIFPYGRPDARKWLFSDTFTVKHFQQKMLYWLLTDFWSPPI